MSINYKEIVRGLALRTGQMIGGAYAAREAAYANATPSAQLDGVDVPHSAMKQDILMCEKILVEAIGNCQNPVLRAFLLGASSNIAGLVVGGTVIPTTDSGSKTFFGRFDGIYDSSDGRPLTEQPLQVVERRIVNSGTFHKLDAYIFCENGTKVIHTRTNAIYRGVSWNETTQNTNYDAGTTSPLPPALENLWIDLICAGIAQEDWFLAEAGHYAQLVRAQWVQFFPGQPMPDTRARVNPVKD